MPTLPERLEGGLLGLLIGDALGVPYEFHAPEDLPAISLIEFEPPEHFRRAHPTVRTGVWSDDGAQALCLLESLLHCGHMDVEDFGRRLVNWYEWGHLAVGNYVFDVGNQTASALRAIRAGTAVMSAASRDAMANGNGSLMRVLPLALWHVGSDEELVRDAMLSSVPTHAHLRSQLCCALYCLWARRILQTQEHPWESAVTTLRKCIEANAETKAELESHIRPDADAKGGGSGYVVDTLRSARMVMERGPYENVVKSAVSLGHDTDTTACVAGGIAGVRDGVHAIPQRWKEALRGRELVTPLLQKLLEHRAKLA